MGLFGNLLVDGYCWWNKKFSVVQYMVCYDMES